MRAITQECYELYWTSPGGNTSKNNSCTATYHPSRKPSKSNETNMRDTAGEVRMNSKEMYFYGPLHMDEQRLHDQIEPMYNSSTDTWCSLEDLLQRWMIKMTGERGSGKSLFTTWHDKNDDDVSELVLFCSSLCCHCCFRSL